MLKLRELGYVASVTVATLLTVIVNVLDSRAGVFLGLLLVALAIWST